MEKNQRRSQEGGSNNNERSTQEKRPTRSTPLHYKIISIRCVVTYTNKIKTVGLDLKESKHQKRNIFGFGNKKDSIDFEMSFSSLFFLHPRSPEGHFS